MTKSENSSLRTKFHNKKLDMQSKLNFVFSIHKIQTQACRFLFHNKMYIKDACEI